MRKIIFGLLFLVLSVPFYGQTQEDNLRKYWEYRERLRTRFMVVSENVMDYGVNIPASDIFYDAKVPYISWGDANNNMSHYLSVLATELWLLKHNNQNYASTLKELYYAMLALERLDTYSESNLRWKAKNGSWVDDWREKTYFYQDDINGFLLRDDVSEGFWKKYGSHFDVGDFEGNFKTKNHPMEENSQDVIEHDMEGLALVSKLVGTESVAGIPCDYFPDIHIKPRLTGLGIMTSGSGGSQSVNFSLWAQDFVKRFIRYMQNNEAYGLSYLDIKIFGKKYKFSILSTNWILKNPVTGQCVMQGSGNDGGVAMISNGIIQAGEAITGKNLRLYNGLFSDDDFNLAFEYPHSIHRMLGSTKVNTVYEDNLTRSLACTGNVLGAETFAVLRNLRDRYNPNKADRGPIYEHLPLMYLALHDPDYNIMGLEDKVYKSEKALYEGLLNSAPTNGPASNCGVWEWTSTSRCLWPQNLGKTPTEHTEYNGLDYMMLHNLYYIAFREKDFTTNNN